MNIYPTVKLDRLPRLADFAKWGFAIGEALGKGKGQQFIDDYWENVRRQSAEVIQGNTLCQAVLDEMSSRNYWETTVKSAWQTLFGRAQPERTDATFPKDAKNLRRHLERIQATLMDSDIVFSIGDRGPNGYPITFSKVAKSCSSCSSSSFNAPSYCNNEDICNEDKSLENESCSSSSQQVHAVSACNHSINVDDEDDEHDSKTSTETVQVEDLDEIEGVKYAV
jgi:hypothetical protein